jgi:acyl carrier protein
MNGNLSAKLREIIAAHFEISPDRLTSDSRLRDLGADRFDRIELMIAIEDQVAGIEIDDVMIDQIDTIGDLMRVIEGVDKGGWGATPGRGMGATQREG